LPKPTFGIRIKDQSITAASDPVYQVTRGVRRASLFGQVDYIADYKAIVLHKPVADQVTDVLKIWCASEDLLENVHRLTKLVGRYIVLLEEAGTVAYVYSGNEATFPVYYGRTTDGLLIHTEWIQILKEMDQIQVSDEGLEAFVKIEYIPEQKTLFSGLDILKPYALYEMTRHDTLSLVMHTYPGLHTVNVKKPAEYGVEEYFKALSAYHDHFDTFSLAFSGGIDSRLLAYLYRDKLTQLLTITHKPPYISSSRLAAHCAAEKLAAAIDIDYTHVQVDFEDCATLEPYFQNFARTNPFNPFLATHYYQLTHESKTDALMSGQNGDSIWHWGLVQIYFSESEAHSTSARHARKELSSMIHARNLKSAAYIFGKRYLQRLAMIKSYHRPGYIRFAGVNKLYGPHFDPIRRFPYKMFSLDRYVDYCTTSDTVCWMRAGEYFGKEALLPYISPLTLHISSHIQRRHFFDLKAPFRHIYSEFDPVNTYVIGPPGGYAKPYASPMFYQSGVEERNRQFLNTYSPTQIQLNPEMSEHPARMAFYQTHLYHVFTYIQEQLDRSAAW